MRRMWIGLAAGIGIAAAAEAAEWNIDPAHTTLGFSVRHVGLVNVRGQFTNYTATAAYDPAAPEGFSVTVRIRTASVDTSNKSRDDHLRGPDFFDAAKFPEIVFQSKELKPAGEGAYELTGDLTLHGVTQPITLKVAGLGKPVEFGGTRIGMSLSGRIHRNKFGLTWNRIIEAGAVVGNDVKIDVDTEFVLKAEKKP